MRPYLLSLHRGHVLAVEARRVERVLPMPRLSALAGAAAHVSGAFVLAGRVVPVVDLDARLGLGPAGPPRAADRLLLLDRGKVALRAGEPRDMATGRLRPLPDEELFLPEARPFLSGVLALPDGVAAVLDLGRLLKLPETLEVRDAPPPEVPSDELAVLEERAREFAAEPAEDVDGDGAVVALVRLAGERFAVPLESVREFCFVERVVRVPGCPSHICGLTVLRGSLLQLVDVREALGLEPGPPGPVAVVLARPRVGVVVDEVEDVRPAPRRLLRPLPGAREPLREALDLEDGPAAVLPMAALVGRPDWIVDHLGGSR